MSYRSNTKDTSDSITTCAAYVIVFLFNMTVGTWSVNYLLAELAGKTIPLLGAALIALFAAEVSIPVAIVVWLLKAFGVL